MQVGTLSDKSRDSLFGASLCFMTKSTIFLSFSMLSISVTWLLKAFSKSSKYNANRFTFFDWDINFEFFLSLSQITLISFPRCILVLKQSLTAIWDRMHSSTSFISSKISLRVFPLVTFAKRLICEPFKLQLNFGSKMEKSLSRSSGDGFGTNILELNLLSNLKSEKRQKHCYNMLAKQ